MAALVRIVPFLALLCCSAVVVRAQVEDHHHDPTHGHGDHHPFDGVVHECQHDSPKFQAIQEVLHNQPRAEQRYGRVDDRGFHTMSVGGIRFAVSTLDLDDTTHYCTSASGSVPDMQGGTIACSASTVFTAAMKSTLINYIIPAALSRLSGAISVDQIQGNLMVPSTSACGSPWTIPSSHVSTGIANADYVVYVSAAPTSGNVIAWAGYCSKDQNGRPFVGRMNFSPAYIYWSTTDMSQNQLPYNTLTHELTHALGFSYTFATTGFKSGVNVVTSTTVRGGQPTNIVTSAKVLAAGKTYFGCSTIAGVELEDEGSSGTMNSHWERRNLMQELMNGMTDATGASGSRMSVMTLSYLEDTGYYYIDYTKADAMQYGNNQGCSFLNNKCDSTSPQLGTYWCSDTSTSNLYCTWDQKAIGYCATGTYSSALASYWQYFSNPNIGGTAQLVDYCPMVQYYSNRICNNASYVPDPGTEVPYGFVFGTDSRCVVTSSGFIQNAYAGGGNTAGAARCLHSRCPGGTRIQYSVDGTTWVNCPTDGSAGTISAPTGYTGTITCPTAASFCDSSLYYGTTTAASTTTTVAGTTTTSGAATTTAVGATTTPSATTVTPPPPTTTTTTAAATPAATPTPGSSTCDTSYLLSTSSPSPSSVLSVASINAILTAHNNARRTVSPYAQVMPMLTWNQSLADFAQNYMNTCPGMVHSTSTMRSNVAGFSYIGENLAAGSSNATYGINGGAASTSLWVGEQQYWSYGQVCQSGQVCGHYTQVIWAATLQVGCGWAYCPNQPYLNYWSCNYGPGGNYVGQNEYVSTTTSPSVCQIQTGQTTTTSTPGTLGTTTIGTTAPGATTTAMVPTPPTTTVGPTVTSLPQTDTGSATSMQSTTSSGTTQNGTSIPVLTTTSSSAPQQLTTTAPPVSAPTVAPTRQLVNGVIRIAGTQFNTLLSNSTMRTELAAYVALDIARLLGIPVSCVVITSLSIGSLVVNYTVTTDALQTTTSSSVQQAASSATASSSWLVNTSALYAQVAPTETLSVASSTTTSASVTPAPVVGPTTSSPSGGSSSSSSSCGSACIGFYAAIAAAAVLVVGGGIFVLLGRPKRVIPAEDNTPPPTVPTARKPY